MEPQEYADLTVEQLAVMLADVGMHVLKKLKHAEAVRRLQLRLLVDPRHFAILEEVPPGPGRVGAVFARLPARLISEHAGVLSWLPPTTTYEKYDDRGVRMGGYSMQRDDVYTSQLYEMMANPGEFDDLLLTLVPLGTYKPGEVWLGLGLNQMFDDGGAFSMVVPKVVRDAYKHAEFVMATYSAAVKAGETKEAAMAAATAGTLPFEPMWFEDVGRRGHSYPRLVFVMPNGDIWSTPPYGLLHSEPIPLQINGVSVAEYRTLADIFTLMPNDGFGTDVETFLVGLGAKIGRLPYKPKEKYLSLVTNLREIIDRVGLPGIQELFATRAGQKPAYKRAPTPRSF